MMFKPETALITGGGSGIGAAMARALAARGTFVTVADVNFGNARAVSDAIGGRAAPLALDVRDAAQIEAAVRRIRVEHGKLDCVVNCAGITSYGEAVATPIETWTDIITVNLLGTVIVSTIAYRTMAEQGHGTIINMGSMAVFLVDPMFGPYTTSKFGVVGFSRALAVEAKARGVNVCVVCPGNIRTPLQQGYEPSRFTPHMNVETAVLKILAAVAKRRTFIVFPLHTKVFWWLDRISPRLLNPVRREILRRAKARI